MPKLLVSKHDITIVERQFQESFLIIRGEKLFWHFYPSEDGLWVTEVDNKNSILSDSAVSGTQQFILIYTGQNYEVNFVLPDWSLSINNITLPKGFYNTFEVAWEELRVEYQGYKFLFSFDTTDIANETVALPKPVYLPTQQTGNIAR